MVEAMVDTGGNEQVNKGPHTREARSFLELANG